MPYRARKCCRISRDVTDTNPIVGSLSSLMSASGILAMIVFFRLRSASKIAELRRKDISYSFNTAAAAPNSGGCMNSTVGLFATMKFPGCSAFGAVTLGNSAHWSSVTQNPSNPFWPRCSWHRQPKAVLTALKKLCKSLRVSDFSSGSISSDILNLNQLLMVAQLSRIERRDSVWLI